MPTLQTHFILEEAVERNPVRAKIVIKAEEYLWSSAAAHCRLKDDKLLSQKPEWKQQCEPISDWSAWLAENDDSQELVFNCIN